MQENKERIKKGEPIRNGKKRKETQEETGRNRKKREETGRNRKKKQET